MSGPTHLCSGCRGKFGPPGSSGRCSTCSLLGRFIDLLYSDRFPAVLTEEAESICRVAYHQALEASDGHLARLEHLAATREVPVERGEKGARTSVSPGKGVKEEAVEHPTTAAKKKPVKPEDRDPHFAEPVGSEAVDSGDRRRESHSRRRRKRRHSDRKDKRREREDRSHHRSRTREREEEVVGRRIDRKSRRSPSPEDFEEIPIEEEESEESSPRPRSSGRRPSPGTRERHSPPRRAVGGSGRPAEPSVPPPGRGRGGGERVAKRGRGPLPAWHQRGKHWGKNKGNKKREREQQYRRYGRGTGDRRRS